MVVVGSNMVFDKDYSSRNEEYFMQWSILMTMVIFLNIVDSDICVD